MTDICVTPQCVTAAAEILHNLHPNYNEIDPCERFDDFACGGFPSRYPLEEEASVFGRVAIANRVFINKLLTDGPPALGSNDVNNLLTDAPPASDEEEIYEMLVKSFGACMDVNSHNETGLPIVTEMVERVAGLFPIDVDAYASNETMTDEDLDSTFNRSSTSKKSEY